MIYLRSFVFYIGYLSSGVLASIVACLVGPFISLNQRLKLFSLWPKFANWFLHATCNIKVEIIGEENLPQEPCVVVSNHQGQWESFFLQTLFIPSTSIIKKELLYIPLFGWALRCMKPITLNRLNKVSSLKKVIKKGLIRLKKGFSIDIWNKLHLQIIFYGREYCTARGCDGRVCSICTEINKGRKSPIITNKA